MSKLYIIKPKPILSYYVNIYTKQDLCNWFKKEYKLVLKFIKVKSRKYIHNINKKRYCLVCLIKKRHNSICKDKEDIY
jgi:hypothetical protein